MDPVRRMSDADRAGFVARSPEGHAAKSMHIKGQEEVWIRIQADTFKNWANTTLREAGYPSLENLDTDFQDGTKLVNLVEVLQKRKLKHNKKPINQHHELENITIALDAITEDGIKLVNIGNTDIHNGNLKLILALLWSLIAHYQLGASNFPPKKLMLAWLRAVLPEDCNIKNFTSDWNNGINLSALIDYCQPGLCPNWRNLDPRRGEENNRRAMEIAEKHFKIPMILEPEYLANPHLDELSGMTYLSYFMKEEDSPGYYATLNWVKNQMPNQRINNFRTDWNDGLAAAALVKSKGGPVPNFMEMDNYPDSWVSNLEIALNGGHKIGVPPILEPRDMANTNVEYLGVMAWVAQFQWIQDKLPPGERLEMQCDVGKMKVGEKCNFNIDILDNEVNMDAISAEVIGPSGPVFLNFDIGPQGGRGFFQTDEMGMHELLVKNEGETVRGAPHYLRSMPQSKRDYDGIEPCAVGSTVEVLINPHHAAKHELLEVTAYSPTNRPMGCPISEENGTFYASFQPHEAGEWRIHVTYDGTDIDNSPFKCMVFNPRAIFIPDAEAARKARPGDPFTFTVDASKTGWGEVAIDVVYENKSIRRTFYVEEVADRIYDVTFTPQEKGKHRVYVYLHGMEVKGSPFSLRIGKDVREARTAARDIFRADRNVSRYKSKSESKAERRYYSEQDVPISAPTAPPRSKKKRQSVREFRQEQQQLFQTDNQTEGGHSLLPINKTIAFDCSASGAKSPDQIFVSIKDMNGKKISNEIKLNHEADYFTCEFLTSLVGEHSIEIVINEDKVDATPTFFTYDSTKIKVGDIPPGYAGMPVEFEVDGTGAGFGNLEIIVNGGRVTCHVASLSEEKFSANFIPHEAGRHRLDVRFNGEKVPHSPWFCEVKDPNAPLMSPGLITGKIKASDAMNGHSHNNNNHDDLDEESWNNRKNHTMKNNNWGEEEKSMIHSKDFSQIDGQYLDDYKDDSYKVTGYLTKTTTTTTTKKESTIQNAYGGSGSGSGTPPPKRNQTFRDTRTPEPAGPVTKAKVSDKKSVMKMEPAKDFGFYSSLAAPSLLSEKRKPAGAAGESSGSTLTEQMDYDHHQSKEMDYTQESSMFETSKRKISDIIEKETTSFNLDDMDLSNKRYSTTLNTEISEGTTRNANNGFREESFLIKTKDPNPSLIRTSVSPLREASASPKTGRRLFSSTKEETTGAGFESKSSWMAQTETTSYASSSKMESTAGAIRARSKSPEVRNIQFSRETRSKTPERASPSLARKSTADNLNKSSPVPAKRKTPPPVARKTSSPGRSLIPKRTGSGANKEERRSSVASSSGGVKSSSKTTRSYSEQRSASSIGKGGKSSSAKDPKKGSGSPKLPSYRGMADKCRFEGETVKHFNAGKLAVFELKAPGHKKDDIQVNIISPEKRPHIPYKVVDQGNDNFRIEFTTVEVGSYVINVNVSELTVPSSPLIAKAYDASLIKVTDIQDGFVGDLSTFRIDASRAGEGQLEISINDGDVPNAVQVLGGGKCLVTYTPEHAITHEIEVTFNGEQVNGSPFLCRVSDPSLAGGYLTDPSGAGGALTPNLDIVSVELEHLGLIPIQVPSQFSIQVSDGNDAELAVSVQGPTEDIPVNVTGNVKSGFIAEFVPLEVGIHMILVEYNGVAVGGTPYYSKAYDSDSMDAPKSGGSAPGKTVTFAGSNNRY